MNDTLKKRVEEIIDELGEIGEERHKIYKEAVDLIGESAILCLYTRSYGERTSNLRERLNILSRRELELVSELLSIPDQYVGKSVKGLALVQLDTMYIL